MEEEYDPIVNLLADMIEAWVIEDVKKGRRV
jgi:hypothetical protein